MNNRACAACPELAEGFWLLFSKKSNKTKNKISTFLIPKFLRNLHPMKALFALNPYIWRYKKHLIFGTLFVIASNIFGVYPAQIVRMAIDMVGELLKVFRLINGFEVEGALKTMLVPSLLLFGGLVILAALTRGIFLFFTRQTLIVMSRNVEYDLHRDLYDHMQNMSLSFYRRNRTGDLMARMTEDVSRVRSYLGPGIMYTINTVSLTVIVVVTMLAVNPQLTLIVLIPLPILSFIIYYVESIIQRKSDKIQKQLSKLTTFTQEIFSGIRVIKAYVKETASGDKFADECETFKVKSMDLAKVESFFFPAITFLIGMSTLLAVWIGGEKVIAGGLTVGNIAEFIIYINLLAWPIIALGWVTTLIQRAAASQVRLNELLQQRSEVKFPNDNTPVEKANMKFEDVNFTYPDTGIHAVKNASFELKPGQKLGILGPTGSGKSTLCALMPRLFNISGGEIYLSDKALATYGKHPLRNAIGYAPQDVFLFSDTIRNNIAFGVPEATQEDVEAAAKAASIYENIMDFPEKFDTMVGERGVTLSGGQKQRISVARAWIRQPKLLILDDVLSAVDTRTEEHVLRNLRAYRQTHPDSAIVMVAHRISCIQDADLIIVIEDGQITQQGTHEALIQSEGYYQRIYQKQLLEEEKA